MPASSSRTSRQRLAAIPDEFELDPQHRVTPIDYGDVCLNYDTSAFARLDAAGAGVRST